MVEQLDEYAAKLDNTYATFDKRRRNSIASTPDDYNRHSGNGTPTPKTMIRVD